MALIFSLYARCPDAEVVGAFVAHFDGLQWTLADGHTITLDAEPYSFTAPQAPPDSDLRRSCWVTASGISTWGVRHDADAIQMTELGARLCAHLRTAPAFEFAQIGIEVDQQRDDAELIEMVRDGWTGLVVAADIHARAGAPVAFEPFRDGMLWRPYIGEWEHPSVRHVPDPGVVTCLGCDEPIRDHEMVRLEDHGHRSCCVWHPYHVWCIREAPPPACPITECADCSGALDLDELRGAIRWGAATTHHLHLRTVDVQAPFEVTERSDVYAGKPRGVSRRAIRRATGATTSGSPHELHELVHDACPTDDPWRLRLRAAPGDDELRRVYADHLEQAGDLARAALVRALVEVPDAANARATADHLRSLAAHMARDWLRDVCRRA